MKNIKTPRLLLGIALLGATTLFGFNSPASARPGDKKEVKKAKKEVKKARKELQKERKQASRPTYRRPVTNRRPYYGSNTVRTLTGVVTNDTSGDDFNMRTSNGGLQQVYVLNGEPRNLDEGDTVRVRGLIRAGVLRATSVTILRNN